MPANTSVLINVGSKTAEAVRGLNKVTDSLEKQQKASKGWGKQMLNAGNLAKAGFAAAGLAAVGVAASFIEFGKAAIDDQKEAQNLANSLSKIPGVTKKMVDANSDWIDSMELATNIADTDLRVAMSRLAKDTGSVAEAQRLVAIAADVSIGRSISLAAATKLVEKAATGHTEALMRQMPWLDKNKDGALTTAEAVTGLGNAYKGAADKAADNDPWKRLQTIWGQLKEALGQWILPLLKRFGDWFKDKKNQQKIQELIDKVANLSYQLGVKLTKAIQDFIKWLKSPEGQKAMNDFKNLAQDIGDALKWIMHWADKLKVLHWAIDLNPLRVMAQLLERIKGAIQWINSHRPHLPTGGGAGSWSATTSSTPTVGTQIIHATFNLTGSPEANVRQIDRYLRRAGDRSRVSVTA